jgi:hypothetical protein
MPIDGSNHRSHFKKLPYCLEQRGIEQLLFNTEGKTDGKLFNSDRWSSDGQILLPNFSIILVKLKHND